MQVLVITQARTSSTRLPSKVLLEVAGKSLLQIHLERIRQAKLVTEIIVATTTNKADDAIVKLVKKIGNFKIFRGSETDVLDRFYQTAKALNPKYIVRLTSDCPLIDPVLVDTLIEKMRESNVDYYSNALTETFPDGQDIEIFTFKALEQTWKNATLQSEREHVTPYIRTHSNLNNRKPFLVSEYTNEDAKYATVRMTVDEQQDYEVIKLLINNLGLDKNWKEYADYYLSNSTLKALNKMTIRNEGYIQSLKKDKHE